MNKIKKVIWVIERNFIKLLDGFSPRKYMKYYNRYLKKVGIDFKGEGARYIHSTVRFDGRDYRRQHIGNNVVISRNVLLLIHDYSVTCGLRAIGEDVDEHEACWVKDITIGDNVFVGANVTILPGTCIGNNTIIGAGAVIKGNIPENAIVIGNPAKVVGNTLDWAKLKKEHQDFNYE